MGTDKEWSAKQRALETAIEAVEKLNAAEKAALEMDRYSFPIFAAPYHEAVKEAKREVERTHKSYEDARFAYYGY